MRLNQNLVGKEYAPQDYGVTAEAITQYARAYNEKNACFFTLQKRTVYQLESFYIS